MLRDRPAQYRTAQYRPAQYRTAQYRTAQYRPAQYRTAQYRTAMDRLTWWHDLSREPGGSIGIATLAWQNGIIGSSGPGVGLSCTAPLKTLRITGAPRTKYSKDYTLPANIWGTQADRAFLAIDHNPKYYDYGPDEPTHVPFWALGGAYHRPRTDIESVPREVMLKNVYHRRYVIRAQAAKALRAVGAFDELEKILRDPDPRVRRAGLDGLIDYNFWFAIGRNPISTEQFSPAMLKAIKKMLSDPNESRWVIDGALMALKFAPASDIQACKSLIVPWTKHSDWWLRESSFMALSGLEKDDALYLGILPTLLTMVTEEYHTQPRSRMLAHLKRALKSKNRTSPAGKLILAGLENAVGASDIKPGIRSPEGAYNVLEVARACLQDDPTTAVVFRFMRQTGQFGQCREKTQEIDRLRADGTGTRPRGQSSRVGGNSKDQRNASADSPGGELLPVLLLAQMPTVIAPQHDDRVVAIRTVFERVDDATDHSIGKCDRRQVALNSLLPLLVGSDMSEIAIGAATLAGGRKIVEVVLLVA